MKKLLVFVALACLLAVAPNALFEQAEAVEENGYYEYNAETGMEEYFVLQSANSRSANVRSYETVERDSKGNIVSRTTQPQNGTEKAKTAHNASLVPNLALSGYFYDYDEITDRSTVQHRAVGYIHVFRGTHDNGSEEWTYGTGFLEGPNLLVTAGHLCYDSIEDDNGEWGWTENLYFYPGAYTDDNGDQVYPYGSAQRNTIIVSPKWKDDGNNKYEWGIVTLKTAIGNRTGNLGKQWQSSSYVGTEVVVTGYPRLYGMAQDIFYMYESSGSVVSNTKYILDCNYDSYRRASGSPVFLEGTGIVIGIQSHADTNYCYAVRITEDLYDLLQEKLDAYLDSQ